MRRNDETLQADGSGKLYRNETNFPNSKIYIKDLPGHTYNFVDDAFDGRITVSHKGVHFAETQYGFSDGHGFWEDELDPGVQGVY